MVNEPRAAIVGAGLMGRWHAEAAARAGARVSVVVDSNAARAAALAAQFRGCRAASLESALAAADVVHVCTPTATHATIAGEALRAGRHVLLEKPVAATVGETAALLEEADARRLLVCPTHQFVFQRGVRRVLDELGSIGPLRDVTFTTCSAGAAAHPELADQIADEILPHPLSLLQRLFQAPVADLEWSIRRPSPGEVRAAAQLAEAAIGITISMAGRPTSNGMVVVGTEGTFEIDLFHGFAIHHRGAVSRARKAAQPFTRSLKMGVAAGLNLAQRALTGQSAYPGLWELVDQFYRAVQGTAPAPISPADTLDVARGVEQLRASASSS